MAKKRVWVMTQESNVNGEIYFNVIVCKDKETAIRHMEREKKWIREESRAFKDYDPNDENLILEETDHSFYIEWDCDDYYEDICIEEIEIQ